MYLSYSMFFEGNSDRDYFNVLVPRIIDNLIRQEGVIQVEIPEQPIQLDFPSRRIDDVVKIICDAKEAVFLFFVHSDTGGRALEGQLELRSAAYCREMKRVCDWSCDRCIVIAPRHETEAWVLLDQNAVAEALGYTGDLVQLGMPANARECERLTDPKATLNSIIQNVRGRRAPNRASDLYPAIAIRQSVDAMRQAPSFLAFETQLRRGLQSLGCLPRA